MPTMKAFRLAYVACILLFASTASIAKSPKEDTNCPNVAFDGDAKRWAQPWVVVAPTYPPELLQSGRTGVVDIEAHVPLTARISEIQRISSDPPTPEFEAAVTAVVKNWFFYRETGCDCAPKASDVKLRVWFEIREGKPSVSISSPSTQSATKGIGTPVLANRSRVAKILQESYPREARRASAQADVYAALRVNPDTGSVDGVEVKWIDSPYSFRRAFERAVTSSLVRADYKVDKAANPWPLACIAVRYRLSGYSDD